MVSDHVSIYDSMNDRRIALPEVEEKFGCAPALVPDALGIWGDSSDNIPGVKGIGEKGVKALLSAWQGLDDISPIGGHPAGDPSQTAEQRDSAYLSKHLATIAPTSRSPSPSTTSRYATHRPPTAPAPCSPSWSSAACCASSARMAVRRNASAW
jgi:DNA polymerase-1